MLQDFEFKFIAQWLIGFVLRDGCQATVAYYLLLDSEEKKGPNEYLEGEFSDLVSKLEHAQRLPKFG